MKLQRIEGEWRTINALMSINGVKYYLQREWSRLEDAIAYISLMK